MPPPDMPKTRRDAEPYADPYDRYRYYTRTYIYVLSIHNGLRFSTWRQDHFYTLFGCWLVRGE